MVMLLEGERVEANDGYHSEPVFIDLSGEYLGVKEDMFVGMWIQQSRKGEMRANHEATYWRFKQLNCLSRIC